MGRFDLKLSVYFGTIHERPRFPSESFSRASRCLVLEVNGNADRELCSRSPRLHREHPSTTVAEDATSAQDVRALDERAVDLPGQKC